MGFFGWINSAPDPYPNTLAGLGGSGLHPIWRDPIQTWTHWRDWVDWVYTRPGGTRSIPEPFSRFQVDRVCPNPIGPDPEIHTRYLSFGSELDPLKPNLGPIIVLGCTGSVPWVCSGPELDLVNWNITGLGMDLVLLGPI